MTSFRPHGIPGQQKLSCWTLCALLHMLPTPCLHYLDNMQFFSYGCRSADVGSCEGKRKLISSLLTPPPSKFLIAESQGQAKHQFIRLDDGGRICGTKQMLSLCYPFQCCLAGTIPALFRHLFALTNLIAYIIWASQRQN